MQDRSTTIMLLLEICSGLLNTIINDIIKFVNIFHMIPPAFFTLVACSQQLEKQHDSSPTQHDSGALFFAPKNIFWALLSGSSERSEKVETRNFFI